MVNFFIWVFPPLEVSWYLFFLSTHIKETPVCYVYTCVLFARNSDSFSWVAMVRCVLSSAASAIIICSSGLGAAAPKDQHGPGITIASIWQNWRYNSRGRAWPCVVNWTTPAWHRMQCDHLIEEPQEKARSDFEWQDACVAALSSE